MNYYNRHLGDYYKKAARLSMLEHGAYTLLIDSCYDRERFPTESDAMEWAWASTESEIEAVKFILKRFFTLEDGVYYNSRIQDEIDLVNYKSIKNKSTAEEREQARADNRPFDTKLSENRLRGYLNDPSTDKHESFTRGLRLHKDATRFATYPIPNTQDPIPNSIKTTSPEPQATPDANTVMVIPTISFETKGEVFNITEPMIAEWQETYPLMAVEQELKRAVQWARDNRGKRKTLKGMRRYLGSWLSRKHDQGYSNEKNIRQTNSSGKLSGAERTRRARDELRRKESEGSGINPV
ncbi:MAG: hypothetical protein DRI24_18185 [Deltaproteobacteria bacterium]|nr:MAG: hypothetical protein DRI24_18185 [Deltaproteobacteria bacterium]